MNYVIFDLEYNQQDKENNRLARTMRTRKPSYLNFEILQIGAIKVDDNLKYVSNFKMYVKPKFLPKIKPHVLDILNTSEEYIRINGLYFNKVFEGFKNFIGQDNCTLVTWSGGNDIGVLKSNLGAWRIKFDIDRYKHIDLQQVVIKKDCLKLQPSLEKTAIAYGIDFNNSKLHDAYVDATVTKQLLQKIGIYDARLYTEEIDFKTQRKIDLNNNTLLSHEFKKIPHCNKCGKFIKTNIKTDFYIERNKNILKMNKVCYCDKCKTYVFKDYKYKFTTKILSIKDKTVHKNNNHSYNIMKKEFDFIKDVERIQLLK